MDDKIAVVADIETTGLEKSTGLILEIALIHYDLKTLEPLNSFSALARHSVPAAMSRMDAVVRRMHLANGLLTEMATLTMGQPELRPEQAHAILDARVYTALLGFGVKKEGSVLLTGNSIHFDRGYIDQHLPLTSSLLFYRMVDVSTLNTVNAAWSTDQPERGVVAHRAEQDAQHSLSMLAWHKAQRARATVAP